MDYAVPADFPHSSVAGALSGSSTKLPLVEFDGRYYVPGDTPPERYSRWQWCEDLARQFQEKCIESKAGKRAHMTEAAILQQYYERLLKTGWASDIDLQWVICRTAELLGWPAPVSLTGKVSGDAPAEMPH